MTVEAVVLLFNHDTFWTLEQADLSQAWDCFRDSSSERELMADTLRRKRCVEVLAADVIVPKDLEVLKCRKFVDEV